MVEDLLPRMQGYIYLIRRADGLCCFNGTNNMRRALDEARELGVDILLSTWVKDVHEQGMLFATMFRKQRIRGQWYKLSTEHVDKITASLRGKRDFSTYSTPSTTSTISKSKGSSEQKLSTRTT